MAALARLLFRIVLRSMLCQCRNPMDTVLRMSTSPRRRRADRCPCCGMDESGFTPPILRRYELVQLARERLRAQNA
jgi:hypothetical protein